MMCMKYDKKCLGAGDHCANRTCIGCNYYKLPVNLQINLKEDN